MLKNIETEDLVVRWNMIIDNYLCQVRELSDKLIKINKMRNELLAIRDELNSRDIDIDKKRELTETQK